MAKFIKYREVEVLRPNQKATIVTGLLSTETEAYMQLRDKVFDALSELELMRLDDRIANLSKGRAICSEKDTYDEKKGLALASRRAELKSLEKGIKRMSKFVSEMKEVLQKVDEQKCDFEFRAEKIKTDLPNLER